MYISIGKLLYPKSEEIEVREEDVVDQNDPEEHRYHVRVNGTLVLALTHMELETLVDKGGFALRRE